MTSVIMIAICWIVWKAAGGTNSDTYVPPYLGGDKDGKLKW